MLNFRLDLENPYHNENDTKYSFKSLINKEYLVSKNKFVDFEICRDFACIVKVNFRFAWRGTDHAGSEIELGLLGLTFRIAILDRRHWDYEKNCWA